MGYFQEGMRTKHGKWRQLPSNAKNPQRFNMYEGEYHNDMKHGKGMFKWEAGNSYLGDFMYDERDGWGTMEWIDGSVYKG